MTMHRARARSSIAVATCYPRPALLGPHVIRLRPADHARARIESYRLDDRRPSIALHWQRDPHGNHVARVTFKAGQPVDRARDRRRARGRRPAGQSVRLLRRRSREDRCRSRIPTSSTPSSARSSTPAIRRIAWARARHELLDAAAATRRHRRLARRDQPRRHASASRYVIRDEAGVWTPEETLANGRGSCRDQRGAARRAAARARHRGALRLRLPRSSSPTRA